MFKIWSKSNDADSVFIVVAILVNAILCGVPLLRDLPSAPKRQSQQTKHLPTRRSAPTPIPGMSGHLAQAGPIRICLEIWRFWSEEDELLVAGHPGRFPEQ